jgi:hypothetical protein
LRSYFLTPYSLVLERVRVALKARGATTIRSLGRTFRCLDSYDGNKKVDLDEFKVGLGENGVDLTTEEAKMLMDNFDKDHDGHINFDEFLVGIRGQMNERRTTIAEAAFNKFNKDDSNDYIDAQDLKGVYDVSMHPKHISGEMTEDQIFGEFLTSFGDKNGDGKISKEEWNEYYSAVSSNVDNDDHFVTLMRCAWKLQ